MKPLDFPAFLDPPDFSKDLFSGFHYKEWQPLWSWFRRKVTSSLNVIFTDGFSFRPPPIRQILSLLHRDILTKRHSSGRYQISTNLWNHWTFETYRYLSLGCTTRRKGIKKPHAVMAQGLVCNYVFYAVRRSFEFVSIRLNEFVSVIRFLFPLYAI